MNEVNQINNELVRKSKILLVDDEPGLRTALKTFLEDEGHGMIELKHIVTS